MSKGKEKIIDIFYSKFNDIRFNSETFKPSKLSFDGYLSFTRDILSGLIFIKFLCHYGIIREREKKINFLTLMNLFNEKYQLQSNILILFTSLQSDINSMSFEKVTISTPYIYHDFFKSLFEKIQIFGINNEILIQIISLIGNFQWSAEKFENNNNSNSILTPKIIADIFERDLILKEFTDSIKSENITQIFSKLNKRRKRGAYYTPIKITKFMVENILEYYTEEKTGKKITFKKLPEKEIELQNILEKINQVKILDPACGSGDFLLATAEKLFQIKRNILLKLDRRFSNFEIKHQILLQNIFGVDIEFDAIQNTENRLFFWLLESIDEKSSTILPNIFLNLKVGNSLIGMINEKISFSEYSVNINKITELEYILSAFDSRVILNENEDLTSTLNKIKNIIDLWKKNKLLGYFEGLKIIYCELIQILSLSNINSYNTKVLHDLYNLIRDELYLITDYSYINFLKLNRKLTDIDTETISSLKQLHWHIDFQNILTNNGFNIIIGNPPYIEIKKFKNQKEKEILRSKYFSAYKLFDISILFIERALELVANHQFVTYIITNKFASTDFGYRIREIILTKTKIKQLLDVSYLAIFRDAATYPVILTLQKADAVFDTNNLENTILIQPHITNLSELDDLEAERLKIKQLEMFQLPKKIIELSGNILIIKEILQNKKVKRLDTYGKFYYRILGFTNWISKLCYTSNKPASQRSLRFIGTTNIKPYFIDFNKSLKIAGKIFNKTFLNYDKEFAEVWKIFEKEKISIKEISLNLTAAYDFGNFANLTGLYMFIPNDNKEIKSLLCLLNSKVLNFIFKSLFSTTHLAGGYLRFNSSYLKELPIIIPYDEIKFHPLDFLFDYLFFLKNLLNLELKDEIKNTVSEYQRFFQEILDMAIFNQYFPLEDEKQLTDYFSHFSIEIKKWYKDSILNKKLDLNSSTFQNLSDIENTYDLLSNSYEIREYRKKIASHKYFKRIFLEDS